MDSMYEHLTGALARTSWADRLRPLLVAVGITFLSQAELVQLRVNLVAEGGLTPLALARRRRPVVLVDLVAEGRTSNGSLAR